MVRPDISILTYKICVNNADTVATTKDHTFYIRFKGYFIDLLLRLHWGIKSQLRGRNELKGLVQTRLE